ncbi:MAG TPA: MOP flippase family protein [Gemmatimonadaceae bacterium]
MAVTVTTSAPGPLGHGSGLRHQAASGARWTLLATIIAAGTQLLQVVVLARLLEPREFGLMAMVLIVIGFAQAYTDLGISAAVVQRHDTTAAQLSSLYWLNLATGAVVCALLWAVSPLVVRLFDEPQLTHLLRVLSLMFLIVPAGKQFEMLLQREMRFRTLAAEGISGAVAGTIVAIGGALSGWGVWSLVAGYLVTGVVRTLVLVVLGLRIHRPALHFRRADLRGFVGFGAYQMGERTVNFATQRLDQLIAGSLLSAVALGLYNFAFNLTAQPMSRINPDATKVALPALSRVQESPERLRRGYLDMLRLITIVNAPVLLGLAAVAPQLVPVVFGAQWLASVPLLQLLALVTLSRAIGNPMGSLMLARGRADLGFWWAMAVGVLQAPCLYLSAREGGLVGMAGALLALQVLMQPIAYFLLVRPLLGPSGRGYVAAIARPLLLAGAMAAIVVAVGRLGDGQPSVLALGAQIGTGVVVFALGLLAFERHTLRDLRFLAVARG